MAQLNCKTQCRLIGYEALESCILQAFNQGKMPHALLLTGPRGVGKATFAYSLARFLFYQNSGSAIASSEGMDMFAAGGVGLLPSGANFIAIPEGHPLIHRVAQKAHPDLMVVSLEDKQEEGSKQQGLSVENAREISQFLRLTPAESKYRVVIVDSVDDMNVNAANAILKVLEEPPANALIILISHVPGRLLPTIRSRCQRLSIEALALEPFTEVLFLLGVPIQDKDKIQFLFELSHGSPGLAADFHRLDAQGLYQKIIASFQGFPHMDRQAYFDLGRQLNANETPESWELFSQLLLYFIRQIVHKSVYPNSSFLSGTKEHALLEQMRAYKPKEAWAGNWQQVMQALQDVRRYHLPKPVALMQVVNLLYTPYQETI